MEFRYLDRKGKYVDRIAEVSKDAIDLFMKEGGRYEKGAVKELMKVGDIVVIG
jgi:hypothetical protein